MNASRRTFIKQGTLATIATFGAGPLLWTNIGCAMAQSTSSLTLARGGQALQPIIIAKDADEQTKAVAQELAEYLKRISGATFEVRDGDGSNAATTVNG